MTPPTQCPKCGDTSTDNSFSGVVVFGCFSSVCLKTGHFEQRPTCERRETTQKLVRLFCIELQLTRLNKQVKSLLLHCRDAECTVCAQIMCPHGDVDHFHHTGCPQCGASTSSTIPDTMTHEELLINAVKTHQKVDLFEECKSTFTTSLQPRRCMTLHLPPRKSPCTGEERPQYVTFTWNPNGGWFVLVVRAPGDVRVDIENKDLVKALEARWEANKEDRKRKEAEARVLTLKAITEGLQVP